MISTRVQNSSLWKMIRSRIRCCCCLLAEPIPGVSSSDLQSCGLLALRRLQRLIRAFTTTKLVKLLPASPPPKGTQEMLIPLIVPGKAKYSTSFRFHPSWLREKKAQEAYKCPVIKSEGEIESYLIGKSALGSC